MKKVKLSSDKIKKLLQKKKYKIQSFYCENDCVRFIECRTPLYQKTFFIYIPDKYLLRVPPSTLYKIYSIVSSDSIPTPHVAYLSALKGDDVTSDLLEWTNKDIFLWESNASHKYFLFSKDVPKKEEKEMVKDETTKTKELQTEAKKILKKIMDPPKPIPPTLPEMFPKEEEASPEISGESDEDAYNDEDEEEDFYKKQEEQDEEEEEEIVEDVGEYDITFETSEVPLVQQKPTSKIPEEAPPIQIIFENEKGDLVDTVKNAIDKLGEDTIPELKGKMEDIEEETEEEGEVVGNVLPPSLEEMQTHLGMVCISVSIPVFIKSLDTYENVFLKNYHKLEANEEKHRSQTVENIKNLCVKYSEKVVLKVEEWTQKEKTLKDELVKLTLLIKQLGDIKEKLEGNPEKLKEELPKLENLQKQTEELIYDLNMEILKIKDAREEFLANHTFTLQHTLKL